MAGCQFGPTTAEQSEQPKRLSEAASPTGESRSGSVSGSIAVYHAAGRTGLVDPAIFYGRNNLLLDPSAGFVPGNVFATVTENLAEMAAASDIVWREEFARERLTFRRLDGSSRGVADMAPRTGLPCHIGSRLPNLNVRPQRHSF